MQAPHRLAFALAMLVLVAAGLWWGLVQWDRFTGHLGLRYAVSPTLTHAAVMSLGFVPLFFAGFLFTAGPKWLAVEAPTARQLLPALLLQLGGWWLWLAGAHLHALMAVAGLALAGLGLLLMYARFWRLLLRSPAPDRLHAKVVAFAGAVGVLSLAGLLLAMPAGRLDLGMALVRGGLWGFVVVTYVAVAHRMIPFFTSSAVPMIEVWRPFWVLWALLAMVAMEWLSVWAEWAGWPSGREWMLVRGLLELAAGSVILWLAFAWGLVQSLRIRLLAMLHLGFVWLGLSFVLAGLSQLLGLRTGMPLLGLGALHAMTMGFLGSLLLAMVTRVSCGHSGRLLVADTLVWALFWVLQLAVVLRIVAVLLPEPTAVTALSALLWVLVCTLWGARLLGWYGRPRVDGRPG
ncbi:MAG: NnrS family protein [Burkholderiales bacterium]|nr:MAG: NnrS family protein [Burkholderiales bacterium]